MSYIDAGCHFYYSTIAQAIIVGVIMIVFTQIVPFTYHAIRSLRRKGSFLDAIKPYLRWSPYVAVYLISSIFTVLISKSLFCHPL